MRVTLVVDNLASEGLRSEHGLSFLIETDGGSALFDTGQSDAWLDNLTALGHDPKEIKAVAISHGHYDHTGGLARVTAEAPDAKLFAHPACFIPKYARSNEGMRCIGMSAEAMSKREAFTLNTSLAEMLPGVLLSGEIPLRFGPEAIDARFLAGSDRLQQDTFEDEQCVILRGDDSTAVLVGCAHKGVENNLLAARDVAGVGRIDLLVGGFHLGDASDDRLRALSDFLAKQDVPWVACCHCTGVGAYEYLRSELGDKIALAQAGSSWEI